MKPILLIAVNFVREQRWPILVLLLWVLLLAFQGLVTEIPREREDLLFIFKQVAVYVVVFSVFLVDLPSITNGDHGVFWPYWRKMWPVTSIFRD